jgi:hypothetical protein
VPRRRICFSRAVTSQDLRQEIVRKTMCALHSCIESLENFCAFKSNSSK